MWKLKQKVEIERQNGNQSRKLKLKEKVKIEGDVFKMPSIFYATVFLLMTPNANIWEGLHLKTHSDHSKLQNLGIYCMRIRFEWRSYSASFHPSPVNGVEQGVDLHFSELLSPLHLLLKKRKTTRAWFWLREKIQSQVWTWGIVWSKYIKLMEAKSIYYFYLTFYHPTLNTSFSIISSCHGIDTVALLNFV